jgi:transposase
MEARRLTSAEREEIYLRKKKGENLQTIAAELKISYECARKWWRRGKQAGLSGLLLRKRGRPVQGLLSQFTPEIRETSLSLNPHPLTVKMTLHRNQP